MPFNVDIQFTDRQNVDKITNFVNFRGEQRIFAPRGPRLPLGANFNPRGHCEKISCFM
jgi:hypothetical protein